MAKITEGLEFLSLGLEHGKDGLHSLLKQVILHLGLEGPGGTGEHGAAAEPHLVGLGAVSNKGKLGCFKVEEGADIIHAGVFLMAKTYALNQCSPEGVLHAGLKGNGIPSKVLKMTKTYNDYYKMLREPYKDWVESKRIGCKRQRLEHYAQCKRGLGCYNDKVFQRSPRQATPLGHWRNADETEKLQCAVPPGLAAVA